MATLYLKAPDFEISINALDFSGYSKCRLKADGKEVDLGGETIHQIRQKFTETFQDPARGPVKKIEGKDAYLILELMENRHSLYAGVENRLFTSLLIADSNGKCIFNKKMDLKDLSEWKRQLKVKK